MLRQILIVVIALCVGLGPILWLLISRYRRSQPKQLTRRVERILVPNFNLALSAQTDNQVWFEGLVGMQGHYWILFSPVFVKGGQRTYTKETKVWLFADYTTDDPSTLVQCVNAHLPRYRYSSPYHTALKPLEGYPNVLSNQKIMVGPSAEVWEKFYPPFVPSNLEMQTLVIDITNFVYDQHDRYLRPVLNDLYSAESVSDDERRIRLRHRKWLAILTGVGSLGIYFLVSLLSGYLTTCNSWDVCRKKMPLEFTLTQSDHRIVKLSVPTVPSPHWESSASSCPPLELLWGDGDYEVSTYCQKLGTSKNRYYHYKISGSHRYDQPGSYEVTLTINPLSGEAITTSQSITVQ